VPANGTGEALVNSRPSAVQSLPAITRMKSTFTVLASLFLLISCISAHHKSENVIERLDYAQVIETYLSTRIIRPTLVYNNDRRNEFTLLNYNISWKELNSGIEITINDYSFSTTDKLTLNHVENVEKDSVNSANFLEQVKIYERDSLIGFVLTVFPCTGLSCSYNYQIIYDLKTKKQSYFGRFRTGSEFDLYNFNSDGKIDYLSTITDGPSAEGEISKEFVLYSMSKSGGFEQFATKTQERFWFKHTYIESYPNNKDERFENRWIEEIKINGR
jgi:hypothetical protein